jgi:hypothetical protein
MSAEELKAAVREYLDKELPGWACAGLVTRHGDGPMLAVEELLLIPDSPTPSSLVRTSASES